MYRYDHKEREPKAFPQYDDAAHIDSAAAAVGADTRAERRSQSNGLHGEILRGAAQITNGGTIQIVPPFGVKSCIRWYSLPLGASGH